LATISPSVNLAAAQENTKVPPVNPFDVLAAEMERLKPLTAAELLTEYEAAGLALKGTPQVPTDEPLHRSAVSPSMVGQWSFPAAQAEIIRRGPAIVLPLIDFLEREMVKRRDKDAGGVVPSFASDTMNLLAKLGDPRAADVLIDIVDGFKGRANSYQRRAALDALERLTYCSFRPVQPHQGNYASTIQHPDAVRNRNDLDNDYPRAAKMYRDWLKDEGRNRGQWLAVARQHARKMLASDDLPAVYCAATFLGYRLQGGVPVTRDDEPRRTLARLADIAGQAKREGREYIYKGQTIPVTIYNWVELIAAYGPLARPHAKTLIRLQEDFGLENSSGFYFLGQVGGEEIMAYLVQCLPKIDAKLTELAVKRDTKQAFRSDDPRLNYLSSDRDCGRAIDRWAGQVFADHAMRLKWWQANKDKSAEQWLRDSLPITAARADKGEFQAQYFLRQLVPDFPYGKDEAQILRRPPVAIPPPATAPLIEGPFRVQWLKDHQSELRYDPVIGGFRWTSPPTK
jgi:hypothetical protein